VNAARTITEQVQATVHLPAIASPRLPRRAEVADWDSEQVRDAVADVLAKRDAYDMCGSPNRVMRVCKEIEILDVELQVARDELASADRVIVNQQSEMRDLRSQLAAERATVSRLRDESNKMRDTITKIERRRVAVSLELLTIAVTGMSLAEITARLNEQVRSNRSAGFDLSDIDDTVVIDLEVSP
jgi:septal ring factor EnvC (AmiA/AmiB activator)